MMNDLLLSSSFCPSSLYRGNGSPSSGIAKAFSCHVENAKTVGNADMKDAYEELRKVTEQRRNADKEIARVKRPYAGRRR